MEDRLDLNIGHATAYAYAVSKGYTGTEEQFELELAQFAQNAQKVAEDRAAVEALVDEFLNTTVPSAVQSVTDEGTRQIELVGDVGTTQIGLVQDEGTTQVGNVNNAGTDQVSAVNQAGQTQVEYVTNEGTTQVDRVQDKGDEVIASIPSDYSDLTAEVDDLSRQISDLESAVSSEHKTFTDSTVYLRWINGRLNTSSGTAIPATNRIYSSILKCAPGTKVYCDSDYKFSVYFFKDDGTFVRYISLDSQDKYINENANVRFVVGKNDNTDIDYSASEHLHFNAVSQALSIDTFDLDANAVHLDKLVDGFSFDIFELTNNIRWEQGAINAQGVFSSSTTRIRTIDGVYLRKGSEIKSDGKLWFNVLRIEDGTVISIRNSTVDNFFTDGVYTIPENGIYYIVCVYPSQYTITADAGTDIEVLAVQKEAYERFFTVTQEMFTNKSVRFWDRQFNLNTKRLMLNPVFCKAGSVIINSSSSHGFMCWEFKTQSSNADTFTPYEGPDWITEGQGYVVKHDCFVSVVIRRTNETDIPASEYTALDYYLINGERHNEKWVIPLTLKDGWWKKSTDVHASTIWSVTLDDVYARWDALVTAYPNYITCVNAGNDASNTYPVKYYRFINAEIEYTTNPLMSRKYGDGGTPTIILCGGIHGSEKPVQLALYNFMYDVCNAWETDETLAFLRHNVNFIVFPCVSPYGFVNVSYYNSNDVNINHNFDTPYWPDVADDHGGTEPASEPETRYVQAVVDEYAEKTAFLYDYHTYGVYDAPKHMMCWGTSGAIPNDDIQQIGIALLKGITVSGWMNHNMPDYNGSYIGVINGRTLKSTNANYANLKGIKAATPEAMYAYWVEGRTFSDVATDAVLTSDVNKMNEEYIANGIILGLKKLIK